MRLLGPVMLAAIATSAAAQVPRMEPGDAHRQLDFMVGEWTVESRMHMRGEVHVAEHEAEVRWLPGGVWLEENVDMPGTPIGDMYGSARIAWDDGANEYVRYWVDNQSHVVLPMRGRFVAGDTLRFEGSFEWIDGTTFHQRLVIRRTDDGWTQTGHMGTDPEQLRLNHEGVAVRRATPSPAPPDWLAAHMEYMTRGSGRWIADNGAYRSDREPFDAYGTEWRWGVGKRTITGRLFGLKDGEEQGTFWEFRLAWEPGKGRVIARQYGSAGVVGTGPVESTGPGKTTMDQTFHAPDGSSFRTVHRMVEESPDTHVTESLDVGDDGKPTPRRTYTWRLEPDPRVGER